MSKREPDDVSSPWDIITQGRRRSKAEVAVWVGAFVGIVAWVAIAGVLNDSLGIDHGVARAAVRATVVILIMFLALRVTQRMERR
jgi:type VI protein secretion system component VasF